MILIDKGKVLLTGVNIQLSAEFSHGISKFIEAQAEAEEKPVKELAPIMLARISGAVLHALAEAEKRKNAAE